MKFSLQNIRRNSNNNEEEEFTKIDSNPYL